MAQVDGLWYCRMPILTTDGPGHKICVWIQCTLSFRGASFSCESISLWQHGALVESCRGVNFNFFVFFLFKIWMCLNPNLLVIAFAPSLYAFMLNQSAENRSAVSSKNLDKFLQSCICKKFLPVILFSAKKEINPMVTYNLSSLAGNGIYIGSKAIC